MNTAQKGKLSIQSTEIAPTSITRSQSLTRKPTSSAMIEYLDFFPNARFNDGRDLLCILGILFVWTLCLHFTFYTNTSISVCSRWDCLSISSGHTNSQSERIGSKLVTLWAVISSSRRESGWKLMLYSDYSMTFAGDVRGRHLTYQRDSASWWPVIWWEIQNVRQFEIK